MLIESCRLCPRVCGALRNGAVGDGFCGMGAMPVVGRAAPHFWEEPCISGERGSGTVFFSGCHLGCVYCQNSSISMRRTGRVVTVKGLRQIMRRLTSQGVHNINLVTPTHFTAAIAEALDELPDVPVVWNSGGYELTESLKLLEGKVSVYLPDLKYVSPTLSGELSGAEDYFKVARAALLEMARQVGAPQYDSQGIMQRGILVRHLVLPGHTDDSRAVLDFIAGEMPRHTPVSLMSQYVPLGSAEHFPGMNRRLAQHEYEDVLEHLYKLGLEDGYTQELSSADEAYIPPFDLTGIEEEDFYD